MSDIDLSWYTRHMRVLFSVILVITAILLSCTRVSASCNEFETIQSIILSEATSQPFEAQLEVARVAVTHGACELDGNFYTGYAVALRLLSEHPHECIQSIHCRAYFLRDTIDPTVREPAALSAHIALTETPRVSRYHFDNWQSTAYWWDAISACPNGWWIVGELKVC